MVSRVLYNDSKNDLPLEKHNRYTSNRSLNCVYHHFPHKTFVHKGRISLIGIHQVLMLRHCFLIGCFQKKYSTKRIFFGDLVALTTNNFWTEISCVFLSIWIQFWILHIFYITRTLIVPFNQQPHIEFRNQTRGVRLFLFVLKIPTFIII